MSEQEQGRLEVLNRVFQHQLDVREASQILGVSERHAWRILAAYRKEGAAALAHGNRGRRPANALGEETKQLVVELAQTRYRGFNHTHLTELLAEREGITLARTSIRNMLIRAGVESTRRRRPPRHRVRRERLPQEGMLLQIDGSNHEWLQARGPRLTLLLAVDDATGTFPWALFRKEEDALGYFLLVHGIIERHGIPLALYSDRHAAFRQVRAPRGSSGEPTQFGRAMRELGVSQIFALSPEAKGRVERANQTFQDRLVAELQLAGASTEAEANRVLWEFLPRISKRFGVPAIQPGSAYREVGHGLNLTGTLCFKYQRKVARDNTVKFRRRTLQLLPGTERPTYAGAQVEIQVHLDGSMVACYEGRVIPSQEAPPRPSVLRDRILIDSNKNTGFPGYLASGATPVVGSQGNGEGQHKADSEGTAAGSPSRVDTRWIPLHSIAPSNTALQAPSGRQPTPRQQAMWEAVQEAKGRRLSMRAIGRELGISKRTAKKYAVAIRPPTYSPREKPVECTDDGLAEWADLMNLDTGADSDALSELMALTSPMKTRRELLT